MSKAMQMELGEQGVDVVLVHPGYVQTDMTGACWLACVSAMVAKSRHRWQACCRCSGPCGSSPCKALAWLLPSPTCAQAAKAG